MNKTLLSTYTIRIRQKHHEDYFDLSNIQGEDFYNLFLDFLRYIEKKPLSFIDSEFKGVKIKLTLRLGEDLTPKSENRVIYGRFESGISGKPGKISNTISNSDIHYMGPDDAKMLPLFFYIDIPLNSQTAYLVLQRESTYGIKKLFTNSFREFLNKTKHTDKYVEVNNLLLPKVLENMLKSGKVKQMTVFNKNIPSELDDLVSKGFDTKEYKISTKTVITDSRGIPVVGLIKKLFFKKAFEGINEVEFVEDNFHDISFTIKSQEGEKTYYAKQSRKTLPDLDITDRIKYKDYVPEINSIKSIAEIEIQDMKDNIKQLSDVF